MRTRRLKAPWPFLFSCVPGRGLVQNLPPIVKKPKPMKLKPIPPSDQWTQEALL